MKKSYKIAIIVIVALFVVLLLITQIKNSVGKKNSKDVKSYLLEQNYEQVDENIFSRLIEGIPLRQYYASEEEDNNSESYEIDLKNKYISYNNSYREYPKEQTYSALYNFGNDTINLSYSEIGPNAKFIKATYDIDSKKFNCKVINGKEKEECSQLNSYGLSLSEEIEKIEDGSKVKLN